MTLANRIKKAREAAKLTKSDLARACGVSPASVTQWENGETKTLEGSNLVKIATATGVEANWIATGKGRIHRKDAPNVSPAPQSRPVPVISWVQAGAMRDIDYIADPMSGEWPQVEPEHSIGPRGWALRVEGDSMDDGTDRGIPEGWVIFCDPDKAAAANSFVIAKDVATQQATFKKLVTDAGRWYLKPLNKAYPMMEIDDPKTRVIAVVTEARPPSRKL